MKAWIAFLLNIIIGSSLFISAYGAVKRPPQFIVLAFDNCTELSRWQELSNFLHEMNQSGDHIHFTFFISGTNFLTDANKNLYQGPGHKPGDAEIPFGGSAEDVKRRIDFMNKLYYSGNEFGAHAVGHFDGTQWSTADWAQEFNSYRDLFTNMAKNNGFPETVKWVYPLSEIVGFRAPYLGESSALYPVLRNNHFRYDASGISNADAWPEKKDGLWHFDLVRLKVAGSGKNTLSMDYNFMIAQSGVNPDPKNQNLYRQQMFQTYINYFLSNYTGNRAPIRIGHHFTDFQGGVYNQALLAFARRVCHLPEVRCITFTKLADFMDQLNPTTLKAYQKGDFSHATKPAINLTDPFVSGG